MSLRTQHGFLLIELLIVVAIGGLLGGVGILALENQMPKYHLNRATNQIAWDIMASRREAIRDRSRVKLYFANDHEYRICYDADGDDTVTNCEGNGQFKDIQTKSRDVTFSATYDPLFLPRGIITNGTIRLTNSAGTKEVVVAITGRVRVNWVQANN